MVQIRLTNTRTRRKEIFEPLDPGNVRMYVCGPTVYDRAHLGNARPVVVFDVLFRLLRHVYGEDHVTYVRNFTDVDDKINARAAEAGRPIREITDETIRWFHEDMDALGALRPTREPRATEWTSAMIAMIEALLARGHAYAAEGHVLFRVRSYSEYGALSGRSLDDMIAGARVEVAPFKEDPLDFVLWKPSGADLPGWDSPWGRGRPGWHIECSAMARELLGTSFDIHGGGLDLQFPHHENEIAQSACADPGAGFARVWMHNEMLLVDGKKMSKSLGNFFTVRDLLEQGVRGEVMRFVLLSSHYRQPLDWTEDRLSQARDSVSHLYRKVRESNAAGGEIDAWVAEPLYDDLNTPEFITRLMVKAAQVDDASHDSGAADLKVTANLLGILERTQGEWFQGDLGVTTDYVYELLHLRSTAREKKDWRLSDEIRDGLSAAGVAVRDTANGMAWEFLPVDSISMVVSRLDRAIATAAEDEVALWQSVLDRMKSGEQVSRENRNQLIGTLHRRMLQ